MRETLLALLLVSCGSFDPLPYIPAGDPSPAPTLPPSPPCSFTPGDPDSVAEGIVSECCIPIKQGPCDCAKRVFCRDYCDHRASGISVSHLFCQITEADGSITPYRPGADPYRITPQDPCVAAGYCPP